ncbi:hypothetical protein H6P81_004219 [Aristolochia fimbriata]|uniref:Protein kinase domain-containing protein n=1 Tax=Aristolochia fimbriata TaxID=158543 RepID=A0AAV7FFV7_ARIFI|nr:hypothetical protein H6P81_004219 [Aristolochia fimbriata]
MKETSNFREQTTRPTSPPKIKLLCSFNGAFKESPEWAGKLLYFGGQTRILAVDRSIGISRLLLKIAEQLRPKCHGVCIKYQLPDLDCSGERPLVSVVTDEDVLCMIKEHERVVPEGKNALIRLFVCDVPQSNQNGKKVSSTNLSVRMDGISASLQCQIRNYIRGSVNIGNLNSISDNDQTNQNGLYDVGNMQYCFSPGEQCLHCYSAWLSSKHGVLEVGLGRHNAYFGEFCNGSYASPPMGTPSFFGIESGRAILTDDILHPRIERGFSNHFSSCYDIHKKDYIDSPFYQSSYQNHRAPCSLIEPEENLTFERLYPSFQANSMWDDLSYSDLSNHETCYGSKCSHSPHVASDLTRENQEVHVTELIQENNIGAFLSSFSCNDLLLNCTSKLVKYPCDEQKEPMSCTAVNADGDLKKLSCESDQPSVDLSIKNLSMECTYSISSPSRGFNGCMSPSDDLSLRSQVEGKSDVLYEEAPCFASTAKFVTPVRSSSSGTSTIVEHQESDKKTRISCLDEAKKAKEKGSCCAPKIDGDACSSSSDLATQELQQIKNSDLEEIKQLGTGTYGTVFYGKWRGSDVAIKRIKPSCFTGGELEGKNRVIAEFWKEAILLGQLRHPNVVAFYGVVSKGPIMNLATITEYMVNGSLRQVLRKKDRTIDRRKRIIIAMDAAFGMEYLHEKNIVHFDLKSDNLLVNMRDPQRPVCKIGDLGLSKVKRRTTVSGGIRGTIQWMAPELLTDQNSMVTEKVDVYSFGIVMWELLTGDEPYSNMHSKDILAGVLKDVRPQVPNWCDPLWRSLMERCWSSDPNARPSFSEIAKELRSMAAAANISACTFSMRKGQLGSYWHLDGGTRNANSVQAGRWFGVKRRRQVGDSEWVRQSIKTQTFCWCFFDAKLKPKTLAASRELFTTPAWYTCS